VQKANEIDHLKKDNRDLNSTLKRYRQMIADQERKINEM
jgi:hypothetical protein